MADIHDYLGKSSPESNIRNIIGRWRRGSITSEINDPVPCQSMAIRFGQGGWVVQKHTHATELLVAAIEQLIGRQ